MKGHVFLKKIASLTKGYPLYSQSEIENPLVLAKLFDAFGSGRWFITEYDPETQIAFGYVTGLIEDEWGYISIPELQNLVVMGTVPRIEIDRYFTAGLFSEKVGE